MTIFNRGCIRVVFALNSRQLECVDRHDPSAKIREIPRRRVNVDVLQIILNLQNVDLLGCGLLRPWSFRCTVHKSCESDALESSMSYKMSFFMTSQLALAL